MQIPLGRLHSGHLCFSDSFPLQLVPQHLLCKQVQVCIYRDRNGLQCMRQPQGGLLDCSGRKCTRLFWECAACLPCMHILHWTVLHCDVISLQFRDTRHQLQH